MSILSGAHNAIVPRVMELLREKHMDDVLVIIGGIIPDEDAAKLKQLNNDGVGKLFAPGTPTTEIASYITAWVKKHREF